MKTRLSFGLVVMLSLLQAHLCTHAYANPQEFSKPELLQGIWQSGTLSFTLTAQGELVLKQGVLMTRFKGTLKQDLKGYWWSKEQRLCFFLDLSSRCYEFRLLNKLHKQGVLKLKLGKRWLEFNRA